MAAQRRHGRRDRCSCHESCHRPSGRKPSANSGPGRRRPPGRATRWPPSAAGGQRVAFDRDYLFAGADGEARLPDLFAGRRQLIVYHFMLDPGEAHPGEGCSLVADNVRHLAHLHARDTSFVLVSRAPLAEIAAYKARMGWTIPWYSLAGGDADFNADCGVTDGFGLSVFLRDGTRVCRTYFTTGRGVEALGSTRTFLDLTPLGRQGKWEDSPPGYPQTPPYEWWRRHDEYDTPTEADRA